MERTACFLALLAAIETMPAWSQTGELDVDDVAAVELWEDDDHQERLREAPIDLRTATVEQLLTIPGMRRKEATTILAAVRSGLVVELRQIDLLHGVRPGTGGLLAPFVVFSPPDETPQLRGRIRSMAEVRMQESGTRVVRARQHLLLSASSARGNDPEALIEMRRDEKDPSHLRLFLSADFPSEAIMVGVGTIQHFAGSPLLDGGRKGGIFRPSDWSRTLYRPSRMRMGTDDATAGRGVAVSWHGGSRHCSAGILADGKGRRNILIGWTEELDDLFHVTLAARTLDPSLALGVEGSGREMSVRAEVGAARGKDVSAVLHAQWLPRPRMTGQILVRHLRNISAPGVPRWGSASVAEDAAAVAWAANLAEEWRVQWMADVGRERVTGSSREAAWFLTRGVSLLTSFQWHSASRLSIEGGWSRRHEGIGRRTTAEWQHRPARALDCRWSVTVRSERKQGAKSEIARSAAAQVRWNAGPSAVTFRWTVVRGSSAIRFWNVGPGPSALGLLQVLSGNASLVQLSLQSSPIDRLHLAIVSSWTVRGTERRPDDASASILLEFRL